LQDLHKTNTPACPKCQGDEFELRVLRDEGVASARCTVCATDYLLLDSQDYWFDVIQKGYPRLTRCLCKNASFCLRIVYSFRDDGDVRDVELHSICSACGKVRRQLQFDVDYSGTEHLLKTPLVYCKNPKILYDLNQFHLLLSSQDIERIVDYLAGYGGCQFLCRVRKGGSWTSAWHDAEGAKATIEKEKYLFIYATPGKIEIAEEQIDLLKQEAIFWKRSEVIRIGSKSHICTHSFAGNPPSICYCSHPPTHANYSEVGLAFQIDFSNEVVQDDKIASKSLAFTEVTSGLVAMLKSNLVSWRGRYCFDNPEVHVRVFADRFRSKAGNNGS
jgi:hypothetical protein